MTNATQPTQVTEVTEVTATVAAPAVPKAPSKKSLALAIFRAQLEARAAGAFATNREFRAAVLNAIITSLGVSTASASTMYNSAKAEAEAADATVALGRDPKKVKAPSTGKRGRPQGSKNKPKADVPAETTVAINVEAPAETTVAINVEAPVADEPALM